MTKKIVKNKVFAIILTGGKGVRLRRYQPPKQFIKICDKPIFIHCLEIYENLNEIDEIFLVINKDFKKLYNDILSKTYYKKLKAIIVGGKLRHESVRNAINHIRGNGYVVIQNGVNPTTPPSLIRECIEVAKKVGAASAFIPAISTVFVKNDNMVESVFKRIDVANTCDPQVYNVNIIKNALKFFDKNSSRDIPTIEMIKRLGYPISLVESNIYNFKVTTEIDLITVEYILKNKLNNR